MTTLLETSTLTVLSSVSFPSPPPAPHCGLGELDLIHNSIDDTESLLDPLPPQIFYAIGPLATRDVLSNRVSVEHM